MNDSDSGDAQIVGSCFFHPRSTHVSVGIVNTDSRWAGRGVARQMIVAVIAEAGERPVRLVSSLMNLDSYSLYTRAGFVPRQIFQDMVIANMPAGGLPPTGPDDARVRPGIASDAPAIAAGEQEVVGIEREADWQFFLQRSANGGNDGGSWHVSVLVGENGIVNGALASVSHPASRLIGPGWSRTEAQSAAILRAELNRRLPGDTPVFLVPTDATALIAQCYRWGARNTELHVTQVRGEWKLPKGIIFPSFLPETG